MTESKEMIVDRLRQESALAKLAHADASMSLRQRRAVHPGQEGHVPVPRHVETESLEQQDLPRRVRQMVVAAQDVRHAHQCIVQRIAEEERRVAIRTAHDEIANVLAGKALAAAHEILKLDAPALWNMKTQAGLETARQLCIPLARRKLAAGARIARRPTGSELCPTRHFKLEWCAVARIHQAG